MTDARAVLTVADLRGWYGESQVLFGMDFEVRQGEVVTLLGRNGAGKTTTLAAIIGLLKRRQGTILFNGADISREMPERIARRGIAFCPEERGIFTSLTVQENLLLPPVIAKGGMTLDEILDLFPNLATRMGNSGGKLSGGEQQMLALARILRTGSRFLLLDEPTEGLAPVIVKQIGRAIGTLKERGYTVLLVEQNWRFAARLADRHYVVEHGRIVDTMTRDAGTASAERIERYLRA